MPSTAQFLLWRANLSAISPPFHMWLTHRVLYKYISNPIAEQSRISRGVFIPSPLVSCLPPPTVPTFSPPSPVEVPRSKMDSPPSPV